MVDIKTIFKRYFNEYKQLFKVSSQQYKVASHIMDCRTSAMGGRVEVCEECGCYANLYNSCRDRHCPMCQNIPREKWVDKRCNDILLSPYFHVVFTVPDELNLVIYTNKELLYDLMYKASAQTLLKLSADKKFIGAQIGFTSVLHTWGQNLEYHPHIHSMVLAGGLTPDNKWKCTGKDFFIPVEILSKVFRGIYLQGLKQLFQSKKLQFFGDVKLLKYKTEFQKLIDSCYSKSWYTYIKETFSGPVAVIKYLGRYTHRVGISNKRILSMDDGKVTIEIKDYKDNGTKKTLTMDATEFIRRFLMNVLPAGFVKLRHYGILGNRNKSTKLRLCRKLTQTYRFKSRFENMNGAEILLSLTGIDITKCRDCGNGKMVPLWTFYSQIKR